MNIDRFNNWGKIQEIKEDISKDFCISVNGLSDTQRHHFAYSLIKQTGKKTLYITSNDLQARRVFKTFQNIFEDGILYFPFREKCFMI